MEPKKKISPLLSLTIEVLDREETPPCVFALLYRFMYEHAVYTLKKNM